MLHNGIPTDDDILELKVANERQENAEKAYKKYQQTPTTENLHDALEAYQAFVTYCTADKRWLFRSGDALKLPKDTQFIRLLPPIVGHPPNERLLICIYPAADNESASLQLLKWTTEENAARVELLDKEPFKIDFGGILLPKQPRLNELPYQLETQQPIRGRKTFILNLIYRHGDIEISANENGIRDAYWINRKATSIPERFERDSSGLMPNILKIGHNNNKEQWRDDLLYDVRNNSKPILQNNFYPGSIRGADSAGSCCENSIWFCNDLANVCFWNGQTVIKSEYLVEGVHDVQNIPIPSAHKDEIDSAVLASAGDGNVYLLGHSAHLNSIITYSHQTISQHIESIIGFGKQDILAVDTNRNIHPIQVDITDSIIRSIHKLSSDFSAILKKTEIKPSYSTILPILICDLLGISQNNTLLENTLPYQVYDEQTTNHDTATPVDYCNTHYQLLLYLWSWLRGQTKEDEKSLQNSPSSIIQELITLPDSAPDILWLSVLNNYSLIHRIYYIDPQWKKSFQNRITKYRDKFKSAIKQLQQVQIVANSYLQGVARHLRILDKKHFCFIDHKESLQIWKNDKLELTYKETIKTETTHEGLPCTLLAGERLNTALGLTDKRKYILLATNRGEITIYEQNNDTEQWKEKYHTSIDQDIRCMEYLNPLDHHGILLGGKSDEGHANVGWLTLNHARGRLVYKELWHDDSMLSQGSIRVIKARQYPHESPRLWAANQEEGKLYQWTIQIEKDNGITLKEPKTILEQQRYFYALEATPNNCKHPILVCGGANGQIFGVHPSTSKIIWIAGCGITIKRAVYLDVIDGWLLCGEHGTILIVSNKDGHLIDLIENIGPINTSHAVNSLPGESGNPSFFLSGKHGNLLLLETSQNINKKTPIPPIDILYPLRQHKDKPNKTEHQIHIEGTNPIVSQETIIFKRHIKSLDKPEQHALLNNPTFLRNQTSPRHAWLLNQDIWPDKYSFEYLWDILQDTTNATRQYAPCLVIISMFKNPKFKQDKNTFNHILQCIWNNKCPQQMWRADRIHMLQLSLTVWLLHAKKETWSKKESNNGDSLSFINSWLSAMSQWLPESRQSHDGLRKALRNLFGIHNSTLLNIDESWQKWLSLLAKNNTIDSANNFPLSSLIGVEPLTETTQSKLKILFEQENIKDEWSSWIEQLVKIRSQLHTLRKNTSPRILWKEYETLRSLTTHFNDAQRHFTLDSGFPLFALWYDASQQEIIDAIEKHISLLTQTPINDYLTIETQAKWHHANQLDINFYITNHFYQDVVLESISFPEPLLQTEQLFYPNQKIPTSVSKITIHVSNVKTATPDNLIRHDNDCITFKFREVTGNREHTMPWSLNLERSITTFNQEPRWKASWEKLTSLLRAYDPQQPFIWIDGYYWDKQERERLKNLIRQQYSIDIGQHISVVSSLEEALEQSATSVPIFCPDIPLQETDPIKLAEHFHSSLHETDVPTFQTWALGIWCLARHIPDTIRAALSNIIAVTKEEQILERLGMDTQAQHLLYEGIQMLSPRAIGAWCSGDPIDSRNTYTTPYIHFNHSVWRNLSRINPQVINVWLALSPAETLNLPLIEGLQDEHKLVRRVFTTLLGRYTLDHQDSHWLCTKFYPHLTLLDDDYEQIYLFKWAINATILHNLKCNNSPNICLIFGDNLYDDPQQRPHYHNPDLTCLFLPETLLPALYFSPRQEQLALLNRFAASQLKIPTDRIFRTVGGMTDRGIRHHFFGRTQEISKLENMLATGSGGYLIIGGRRMGKTSLRQYFEYHLKKDYTQHPCISINCEKVGSIKGRLLEKWLFNQILNAYGDWNPLFKEIAELNRSSDITPQQTSLARIAVERVLKSSPARPILILDETEHLIAQDIPGFNVLQWLRGLVQDKVIHLVITSYPHGKQRSYSIPALIYAPASPLYNFLSPITLSAWTPDETWQFIHDKLQLLGIHLPVDLRLPVLNLTRGIPWITHYLGQTICEQVQRGLVTDAHWKDIKYLAIQEIRQHLKAIVQNIAETYDRQHGDFDRVRHSGVAQEQLWPALKAVSKQGGGNLPDNIRTTWPEEVTFTEENVLKYYQVSASLESLRNILSQFTDTGLLNGNPTNVHQFSFADNLLPMIVAEQE
jgi:hypothetical protein